MAGRDPGVPFVARPEGSNVVARIGGTVTICGLLGAIAALWLASSRTDPLADGLLEAGAGGSPALAFIALASVGLLLMSLSAAQPFDAIRVRTGLRALSIGLLVLVCALTLLASHVLTGTSADFLLVPLASGALTAVCGALLTGAALTRTPGLPRVAGLTAVAGLALVLIGNWVRGGTPPEPIAVTIEGLGLLGLMAGGVLLGIVGAASDERRATPAP